MKVLILKPSSLGDVVHAVPLLRMLKRHRPDSAIYWWIDVGLSSLLEGDPDLTGLIPFHRKAWSVPWRWPELLKSLAEIRGHRFELVIDLQALARSGLVAWLSGAGFTIGIDDPREGAATFYDLRIPRPSHHTHSVDWNLAVAQCLGIPIRWDFEWLTRNPAVVQSIRQRWSVGGETWIAIQPGARWLNKRWPLEYFVELVRLLVIARPGIRIAILGSGADKDLGKRIEQTAPGTCLDLTGHTSLPEMVEWIRHCRLLISSDSGPMHVAAAVGTPVVAIFGPTEPRRTGPYGQLHHVLQSKLDCVPCMSSRCTHRPRLECLTGIEPKSVLDVVLPRVA